MFIAAHSLKRIESFFEEVDLHHDRVFSHTALSVKLLLAENS
jgi:hypothetical protein